MSTRRDVVIIGGGAMGAATAWHLARAGRDVTLLEQFEAGHTRGSSHGATRNFNTAYTDPHLQRLVQEAHRWWKELESETGRVLLDLVGLTNHGAGVPQSSAEALRALGAQAHLLTPQEAGERWPGIRFDTRVLHLPSAGRVRADDAVAALHSRAATAGCQTLFSTPVLSIRPGRGAQGETVEVVTAERTYLARRVVVAAGAWVNTLLEGVVPLPPLRVTEEQPSHFTPRVQTPWPSFNHFPAPDEAAYAGWPGIVYGMLTPGEGIKAGWHQAGPAVSPDARPGPLEWMTASLSRYAEQWLPGVDPADPRPVECMYTSTEDSRFVLERFGPIVVGTGFSGEGFKFTPAIGRVLADLALEP